MDLILTQDVEKLGQAGDVVKVKPGYGRNYLLPRGMAMLATDGRVKELEHKRRMVEDRVRKEVAGHELVAKQLDGLKLEFEVQVGEEGKLFGSVTNADIWHQLTDKGFQVERRKIDTGEPIETFTLEGDVWFGVTESTTRVPIDDGATAFGGASTFAQTGGGAASWVLFRPDGTPRSVDATCTQGVLGSGGGGMYLSNASRDAAVVLTPLGMSRAFSWDEAGSTWN